MNASGTQDYEFYGCRLRSQLPLALVPECETTREQPDIFLRFGSVPEELPELVWSSPFLSMGPDGEVLVRAANGIRFLVRSGNKITVQTHPGTAPGEVEIFLMGAVAGVVLHQRGDFPLHASCVKWNGIAVAFAGPCGRGKSTLAKAMVQRGASLLSDDISVIEFSDDAAPQVVPGSRAVRLWPDARETYAGIGETWQPIRSGHEKQFSNAYTGRETCQPLGAIIRLAPGSQGPPGVTRLHGPSAVMPLASLVYRVSLARRLGRSEELFQNAMKLAIVTPIFELRRPDGFDRMDEVIGWVSAALKEAACTTPALVG